jgi:putative transposase
MEKPRCERRSAADSRFRKGRLRGRINAGRGFRTLTLVDRFTRECLGLEAERSMHGAQVVALLTRAIEERSAVPRSIILDNGSEFGGRVLD